MQTYGQEIRWTDRDGTVHRIVVDQCASSREARRMALKAAKIRGWTPARWWQFWRWNDTRIQEGRAVDETDIEAVAVKDERSHNALRRED